MFGMFEPSCQRQTLPSRSWVTDTNEWSMTSPVPKIPPLGVLGHHEIALGDHVGAGEVLVALQRLDADLQAGDHPVGTEPAGAGYADIGVVGVVGRSAFIPPSPAPQARPRTAARPACSV
jgi:hypothetical protein